MKKTLLVVLTVAVLAAVVLRADRAWLKGSKPAAKTLNGPAAPSVSWKDLQGNPVSLAQYKGKVVLVNFWATWCAPCRIEMPWMIEFQQKYGPRGFTVLGIAMDEEGKSVVEPFVGTERYDVDGKQMAVNYPILLGNDAAAQEFGVFGLPTSVLISREGKKVKTFVGLVNHDLLVREIEGLL